jgi:hypothetical protein
MTTTNNKIKVIGVGGFARAGKDTFVKIASKILEENGYSSEKLAFADALKKDLDPFLTEKYSISAFTDNTDEKKVIRPFLVAHGCGKREQTQGRYWVEKIQGQLQLYSDLLERFPQTYDKKVYFVSDCRFPNEVKWLHENWNGWFVHLKRYSVKKWHPTIPMDAFRHNPVLNDVSPPTDIRSYDEAPNAEEAKNDPLCVEAADYRLELENVMERTAREGNKITTDDVADDSYLYSEIKLCLTKCPFLTILP